MMEIIKHGDANKLNPMYHFSCYRCGCIFEARKDECEKSAGQYNETDITYICPSCGNCVLGVIQKLGGE